MIIISEKVHGQTPVPMSTQSGLTYTENFADIANWTNNFAAGIGANRWGAVPVNASGTTGDGIKISTSTSTFVTSTAGGVQKGTGNIQLLSTSTANSCAIDFYVNFSGVNAGSLSFDLATVFNSTGDRDSKLKLFYTLDGSAFTEITGTNLPFTARNNVASSASISVSLPTALNNASNVRFRFYEYSTSAGATPIGSQPKISIDNVTVTALISCTPPLTQTSNLSTNSPTTDGFSLSWTSGNGDGTMIAVRPIAQTIQNPSSGTTYTANLAWSSAAQIVDANNRVVFRASGSTAGPVTGLLPETQYTATAYEYSNTGNCYNLTSPPSSPIYTLSTEPSAHSSFTNCVSPSSTEITLSFNAVTNAGLTNADGYIILQKQGSSAPVSVPSDATSYTVGNAIGDATVAAIINSTSTNSATITGLNSSTIYSFTLIPFNWNGVNSATYNYLTSATIPSTFCTTSAPQPEINLQGNANDIISGFLTTNPNNFTDFGTVAWGSSITKTFTIQNTGSATLNLTGTPLVQLSGSTAFTVTTQPSATSISAASSLTFVISFSPASAGILSATVSIPNNDANENPYTFTIQGTGSANNSSDIIIKNTFTYPTNIPYQNYQSTNIINDANSIEIAQFTLRDGAGLTDADNLATTLNQLVLNLSGSANIRRIALYDGTTEIAEQAGASSVTFSGLSITVTDNGTKDFSVRVSFNTAVTDNQQIQITVAATTSASSSGSTFAATNAGGAGSSVSGDNNRIEVTADRLAFVQQPTNTTINVSMSPSVTISANDINGNRDLDNASSISLTSSGTLTGSPITATATNGLATFASLTHTIAGIGLTLSAISNGLTTATSSSFDIVSYPINSYRTTSTGTWPSSTGTPANWEQFNGSAWVSSSAPSASTSNILYILHTITTNAAFAASAPGTNMVIQNGGVFNVGHSCTFGSLLVQNGGILTITTASVAINSTSGTLTLESGGRMNINSSSISGVSSIWNGTEDFQNGSIVDIQNWNYAASSGDNRLVQNPSIISTNAEGYYFGNVIISGTLSALFVISEGSQTINFCKNNLTVSTTGNNVSFTSAASNVNVGGNLIVSSGSQLSIAATTSGNPIATVLGNIEPTGGIINLNQNSSGTATSVVQLKGNLTIPSGVTLNSTDAGCKIVFSGTTMQTLSIAGTLGAYVDFEVGDGTSNSIVNLVNQNLNLANAFNGISVIQNGTLDFNGFDVTGIGPFTLNASGKIKITSANGVNTSPSTSGNVQTTGTRTFSQSGFYHYIGSSSPQSTGTAMTSGSTAKRIIIEKTNSSDIVNLTQSTGTTDSLIIIQGTLVESPLSFISGSGNLVMSGGDYQISSLSTTLPQLTGTYTLTGGTITLNGSGDQILRGGKDYRNLTFSNSGIKTLSSAPSSITGTITVANAAILDVANNTMGGTGTNLTMTGTSRYKTAGTGIKPDALGTYSLGSGTTIEFTNTAGTLEDIRRASVNYFNIDVSGSNVGNSTLANSVNMQSGSTFTVKSGATFHLKNTAGFLGGSTTSISSSNSPTINLETNSTIDYYGVNQTVTNTTPYQHLTLTGSGTKTSSSLNDLKVLGNLQLDAELALTSTDLYVGGDWNKSVTGNFNANNRIVYFDGANNSTITAYDGQYFPNLILTKLSANNTLALADPLSIGKSLSVTSGILDLVSKDITLLSNDSSTASFGKVGVNGSVTYGSGRFIVERYIPTGTGSGQHPKSWQFLSIPNNDGQTINQAWQDTATSANQNRYSGYGTQITGPGGIANGFDLATSAPSMKTYNSLSNSWNGIANTTSTPIYNAKGYMLFVRGDRSVINFNSAGCTNCTPVPTKLRTRGKLFVPISNPPSTISNIPANAFESVGNPYASAIDFSNITRTASVDASFYVWDPLMNGSYNLGGYRTYTDADGYSGYKIQSGQAFFVHTTGGAGSLSFNEDVKVSGSTLTFRPPTIPPNRQFLRVKLFADTIGSKFADITTAVFDPLYSNDLDNKDAIKLTNSGENIGLLCQNKTLAQEARNKISLRDTLYLTLANCRKQGYQFQFIPFQMAQNSLTPFLIDRYLMKSQEISNTDTTSVNFSIDNTPSSYASDRFIIVFKRKKNRSVSEISEASAIKSSENDQCCGNVIIIPNPVCNGKINIFFKNMHPGNYMCKLMNIKGQVLKQNAIQISAILKTISISSESLPKGVYELQVIGQNGDHFIEQVFIDN